MSIKADGQEFSVRTTSEPIGGEDGVRSFLGRSDEADNTIVIDGTMPKTRQEEVLLHEMIHIATKFNIPEFMATEVSNGLYGLLRENGLLRPNIVDKVSDGVISKADADKLNKRSNERAEEMGMVG